MTLKYPHFVTIEDEDDKEIRKWCRENAVPIRKKRRQSLASISFDHMTDALTMCVTKEKQDFDKIYSTMSAQTINALTKTAAIPCSLPTVMKSTPATSFTYWSRSKTYGFQTLEDATAFKLRWA